MRLEKDELKLQELINPALQIWERPDTVFSGLYLQVKNPWIQWMTYICLRVPSTHRHIMVLIYTDNLTYLHSSVEQIGLK
jgi:hypothetical protein